jgi:predicted membrane protein
MDYNLSPDRRTLRNFGITSAVIVVLIFGVLLPWLSGSGYPMWPWILSGSLILGGLLVPGKLGPVYRAWMKFGYFMNKINTAIILTVVFILVFIPIGLIMKIIGRDVLFREFDQESESYRIISENKEPKKMERPF